jgi:hypothetical protein
VFVTRGEVVKIWDDVFLACKKQIATKVEQFSSGEKLGDALLVTFF